MADLLILPLLILLMVIGWINGTTLFGTALLVVVAIISLLLFFERQDRY